MTLALFKNSVNSFEEALLNAAYHKADLSKKPDSIITFNVKKRKVDTYKNSVIRNMNVIKSKVWNLAALATVESNKPHILTLFNMVNDLERAYNDYDVKEMIILVDDIKKVLNNLQDIPRTKEINITTPDLHSDIKEEVDADIKEISKCYQSGCYRSCVIICGRIMETVLHRKYYEVTGNDALEKSPGIGLGKLIAKLTEKNVTFDPGLTQQIHLINQVRIFSVHKKQEPFYPTRMQANAIILFTLDSVKKLF
ncbi:MAG: hypothetical protein KKA79_09085 [Nanoarchaeota archaeon]|nr:hypothetical protein [Nanoarchaeota archaeon]